MSKQTFTAMALAAALLISSIGNPCTADAAVQGVQVRLPAFKINLNSYYPDLQSSAYPPIVYRDITYVPMTWNNSLRLNLALQWSESEGLSIQRQSTEESIYSNEEPAGQDNDLNAAYQAMLVPYPVTVNGKKIDNKNEPYPILSFRNITYFPLTWRFAHEEFQWVTAWSANDGFSLIAGDRKYVMDSITADNDQSLFVSTNIYGTFKLDKSFQGSVESLIGEKAHADYESALNQRMMTRVGSDPQVQSNQTQLQGDRVMLDGLELLSLKPMLERANQAGNQPVHPQPYSEKDIQLTDIVLPVGSAKLVQLTANLPGQEWVRLLLVNGGQVTSMDQLPMYRKIANPSGSFWVTSALMQSEPHHYSWYEQHLWLIGKDARAQSINEQLGVKTLQILSILNDGTIIAAASQQDSLEGVQGDVYRIHPDGKAEKIFTSVQGKMYADRSGEVFVLSTQDNRITKLSSGKSIELHEKMLFQSYHGEPQPLIVK